jgi:tyrosinase
MITKRTALKAAIAMGATTAFQGLVPGLGAFAAKAPRVRRSVNTMALDDPDLETYREFVGLMRARKPTTRVSWVGFASQHGSETAFKYCPHGDWYFLPWHRGYVEMYEKAAASLTHHPKFAMPYWDWTTLRQLPAAFTDPTYKGKPNPLYVPGRGDDPSMARNPLTGGNALTDALVGPEVMQDIYDETVFEVFGTSRNPLQKNLDPRWVTAGGGNQGTLESTPHNNVHNNIGGFMPQSNSPRDPIFMMHHGNIDRIWAHWNALGRKNSTNRLWLDMPFTDNYISAAGRFYSRTVRDLQSTAALGYTYDTTPRPDDRKADPVRARNLEALFNPAAPARPRRIKRTGVGAGRATAQLDIPFKLNVPLEGPVGRPLGQDDLLKHDVVAIISEILIGKNVRAIRVFINRGAVTQDIPDTDPNYVTTLSFLDHGAGAGHAGHKARPSTIVNLTRTLRRLAQSSKLDSDHITVQLLPVPVPGVPPGEVGEVTPASVEIAFV